MSKRQLTAARDARAAGGGQASWWASDSAVYLAAGFAAELCASTLWTVPTLPSARSSPLSPLLSPVSSRLTPYSLLL